jgi:hypothetical protein
MSRTAENGNVDYDNKGATIFREAEERISRDPNAAVGHEHLAPTQKGFYGHVVSPTSPRRRGASSSTPNIADTVDRATLESWDSQRECRDHDASVYLRIQTHSDPLQTRCHAHAHLYSSKRVLFSFRASTDRVVRSLWDGGVSRLLRFTSETCSSSLVSTCESISSAQSTFTRLSGGGGAHEWSQY